jgi:hypothetical protein
LGADLSLVLPILKFCSFEFDTFFFPQIQESLSLVPCKHYTLLYAKYCIDILLYINQGLYRHRVQQLIKNVMFNTEVEPIC